VVLRGKTACFQVSPGDGFEVTGALPFPIPHCLESGAQVISRPCANGIAIPDLGYDRVIVVGHVASSKAASAAGRKDGLLRADESEIRLARLRPSEAQARSGQSMLRPLRLVCRRRSSHRHPAPLSAGWGRNFCRLSFVRANPLAKTSCSAAPRLIRFRIVLARPALARRGWKETHTGGFHEISICDHSSHGAGRHSERDFELG
jgi:hypothetical protein